MKEINNSDAFLLPLGDVYFATGDDVFLFPAPDDSTLVPLSINFETIEELDTLDTEQRLEALFTSIFRCKHKTNPATSKRTTGAACGDANSTQKASGPCSCDQVCKNGKLYDDFGSGDVDY